MSDASTTGQTTEESEPAAVFSYRLDALSVADPFGQWRALSMPGLGRLFETTPLESFGIAATAAVLGPIGLGYVRVSSQRWNRTPEHIRRDAVDHVMVNVRFAGGGRGDHDGRAMNCRSGCIVFNDLAKPSVHDSDRSHTAGLVLPRALAESLAPAVGDLHGLVIPPANAVLLHNYLRDLERLLPTMRASETERLGTVAVNLLAVALAQATNAPIPPPAPALAIASRLAVEAMIEERLGSATLTVANLCRWLRLSRSSLYRLFDGEGGVQAFIRARRLERVAATLEMPGNDERVGTIAERWGFCDAAYLARVFREVYGMTPGDYRMLARQRACPAA